jgi:threonyl-tRNA synthetase
MNEPRDHRHIAQRLGLFHMQEEAPGMAFWHPRGWTLFRLIEGAVRRHMEREGFLEVRSPQVLRQAVWEASGHWEHFRENMFVLDDDRVAALKPVSCPAHFHVARRMTLSYRDLPMRIGELGLVHRNEQSGALHGLFRLRQFTQDDGHIFCERDQIADEVASFCRGLSRFYEAFGFGDMHVGFSTRPDDRAGSDEAWDEAERLLGEAARAAGLSPELQPGEGAFYGPKLEFVLEDCFGRKWQCGTIQLDLVLAERFDVSYVDRDGERRRPAILHRAVLGSLERFLGILLEQSGGALPGWLAPEQIVVLPVGADQSGYAERVLAEMKGADLRASLDAEGTLGYRIRAAHERGVAQAIVVGAREENAGAVSLRGRSKDERDRTLSLDDAVGELIADCAAPL